MSFTEVVFLSFAFQGFFLGLLFLFKKSGDLYSNRVFGLFLMAFAYAIFFNAMFWSDYWAEARYILALSSELSLTLFGPLFFFYSRRIVEGNRMTHRDLLHLVPFFYFLGCYLFFLAVRLMGGNPDDLALTALLYPVNRVLLLLTILAMVGYGLYILIKYVAYYKHDWDMRVWLWVLTGSFLTLAISYLTYYIFQAHIINTNYDYYISLVMVIAVGMTTYTAIIYPAVFNGRSIDSLLPIVKYKSTALTPGLSRELRDRLIDLMEREKPFLDPDLRLTSIAGALDTTRHSASQVINEHFSRNFNEFINQYRIREAEKRLLSEPELSVAEIAFQSGFNNRTSFYTCFRNQFGMTPLAYRKKYMKSLDTQRN